MKIEKDAEWNRLEGRVGELEGKLKAARQSLDDHARKSIAKQAGVVFGETVVEVNKVKFLVTNVKPSYFSPSFWGRRIRKDGGPSETWQRIYDSDKWTIVKPTTGA